jgi:hypothetical protein
MPRPKGKTNSSSNPATQGIASFFRPIFDANRKLLKTRSNQEVLDMWLEAHPGYKEVPENVKSGLANLKSVMRKQLRIRRTKRAAARDATQRAAGGVVVQAKVVPLLSISAADTGLEKLEMLIDDCLTMAKNLDRKGLDKIIHALRVARNRVVWKLGEE